MSEKNQFQSLEIITGLFAGLLIISNLASTRLISLGPLSFDAGTLTFPLTYIFGDILTEVYGYQRSRRIIWTAFFTLLVSFLVMHIVSLFPAPADWKDAASWSELLVITPRIALASLLAFLGGEFLNSFILSKLKSRNPKKGPALRFVSSTLAGQGLDTLLFASIAFLGVLPTPLFVALIVSNYIYKCAVEIIFLPLSLLLTKKLKKVDNIDHVDRGISYSPFSFKLEKE
ncbi:MAG: queuosine precursor transporter [Deltaproteobacteria bacterium]|jgi:uncharacterized integral membrane protein (TIGR00697 family)|nr:queuosine precursor transporter [Deltaproteobacteria bacterium]